MISSPLASSAVPTELTSLYWLLGDWISTEANTVTTESWVQVSPTTFEGTGETVTHPDGKIVHSESLRILAMAGEIFYLAKVSHNKYPTSFKLVEGSETRAIFQNQDHDFPQQLEYIILPDNQLHVNVSGGDQGFSINFKRQKD